MVQILRFLGETVVVFSFSAMIVFLIEKQTLKLTGSIVTEICLLIFVMTLRVVGQYE